MLEGWLDYHRQTLAWKCDGLTDAQRLQELEHFVRRPECRRRPDRSLVGGLHLERLPRHVGSFSPARVDAQLVPDAGADHRPIALGVLGDERVL